MLNSNIRCIEITLSKWLDINSIMLNSNIRCIEIAIFVVFMSFCCCWIVTLDVLKFDSNNLTQYDNVGWIVTLDVLKFTYN